MNRTLWIALAVALPACGGRIRLDESTVDARLDRIDAGPVISALEVATDGPVLLTSDGQTLEIVLDGARADDGLPAAWAPGVPDAEHPDVVTVQEATATFLDDDGREDFVKGLRYERVGAVPAAITITEGTTGTTGEGYVDVRTAEGAPLLLDVGQVAVTGGTLELRGSGGSSVTVTPGTPGTFTLTLDGAPYARGVDCSAARAPLVEGGLALLSVLPIQ